MADPKREQANNPIRKHIRIEVELPVSFAVEHGGEERVYRGSTKNVSRGGVCIQTSEAKEEIAALVDRNLPNVKVSLHLDQGATPLDFKGRTAWINSRVGWFVTPSTGETPVLLGMSFRDLNREDSQKIDGLIEAILARDRSAFAEIEERISRRTKERRTLQRG